MENAVIIGLLSLVVAFLGFLSTWLWRLVGRIDAARAHSEAQIDALRKDFAVQIAAAVTEAKLAQTKLDEYRVQAAEKFATKSGVSEAFDRLTHTVTDTRDRLERNLERLSDRIDNALNGQVGKQS